MVIINLKLSSFGIINQQQKLFSIFIFNINVDIDVSTKRNIFTRGGGLVAKVFLKKKINQNGGFKVRFLHLFLLFGRAP